MRTLLSVSVEKVAGWCLSEGMAIACPRAKTPRTSREIMFWMARQPLKPCGRSRGVDAWGLR